MEKIKAGKSWATQDFEKLSWHDSYVSGIRFRYSECEEIEKEIDGKRVIRPYAPDLSQLIFDIDFIVSRTCGRSRKAAGAAKFLVAPAELVFTEVYDLRIKLGPDGSPGLLCGMGIDQIMRQPAKYTAEPKDFFSWEIKMNYPLGLISFEAEGFAQTLLVDPVQSDYLRLDDSRRDYLLSKKH